MVVLQDVMSSYASTWLRIAKTQGTETIRVGDVFREVGFGEGAEEMKVEAFEISPIPGGSRLLLLRAYHSTPPQSYRTGAVLRRLEPEPMAVSKPGRKSDQTTPDLLDEP